jgi:hypothetical protein
MDVAAVNRLTRISIENPLMPETFVPWENKPTAEECFLPRHLLSVEGLALQERLTPDQLREIGRHEAVQFMYSYAWSEALAVNFLSREVSRLKAGAAEIKFMQREIIEETRHQEMFTRGIESIAGTPIRPTGHHMFWSKLSCQYLPSSLMFMVVIAGELVADSIGRAVQKDKTVYSVLRKMAELHQIEEGRHIYFAKKYLEDYTLHAGIIRRTIYCITMAIHIHFMTTMYVKEEIFRRVGMTDAKGVYRQARKNYRAQFAASCLQSAIGFANEFNGFNRVSRGFWNWLLKADIK